MNEKQLGKALVGLDSSGLTGSDARGLTEAVLRRDRRLVRLLGALTIILWSLAALGIVVVLSLFVWLAPRQAQLISDMRQGRVSAAESERLERLHFVVVEKAMVMVAVSVAALTLAALGTVALVFAS